jgi:hypothetical protein
MLAFLIDNMFGGGLLQQTPDMPMGTTQGSFQQSLVEIGSVVSEERIFF